MDITGGALRPDKSFWILIDFQWDSAQAQRRYRNRTEMQAALKMNNANRNPETPKRLEYNKALETLSVFVAANGIDVAPKLRSGGDEAEASQ